VTVYTFSEARQKFASLLERARREGAVQIKRRDGQVFLVRPQSSPRSPLDVPGIKTDYTTQEIVDIVRKMRRRAYVPKTIPRKARKGTATTHR